MIGKPVAKKNADMSKEKHRKGNRGGRVGSAHLHCKLKKKSTKKIVPETSVVSGAI